MRLQYHGLLKDRVIMEHEGPAHDEEIIKSITSDPVKQQQLRLILGSDEKFAPLRTAEPEPE